MSGNGTDSICSFDTFQTSTTTKYEYSITCWVLTIGLRDGSVYNLRTQVNPVYTESQCKYDPYLTEETYYLRKVFKLCYIFLNLSLRKVVSVLLRYNINSYFISNNL